MTTKNSQRDSGLEEEIYAAPEQPMPADLGEPPGETWEMVKSSGDLVCKPSDAPASSTQAIIIENPEDPMYDLEAWI